MREAIRHKRVGRVLLPVDARSVQHALLGSCFFLIITFAADPARADGISGYLDYKYSTFTSEIKNVDGQTTTMKSDTFNQQYNVTIFNDLYPNLRLYANGIFEKDVVHSTINSDDTTATTTIARPLVDLTLKTPLYTAGVGYNKREEKNENSGSSSVTNVREEYRTLLGWMPVGLPSLDARFTRTNTYDKERISQNTTEDFTQLTSTYEPAKNLVLKYQGSYRDTDNMLSAIEIKELANSGRVSYDSTFFKNRVSLSMSYDATKKSTEIITSGTGDVSFQVVPFEGLFSLDDTPLQDPLNLAPFLIDHDKAGTNGNLIDLGYAPFLSGSTTLRNMGLNFGSAREINTLFVWVDRPLQTTTANAFIWDIYVSSDGQHWTAQATIASAPFSPFENRFELRFPNVSAQYIKAVTRPLSAVVPQPDANHIYVTEIEPFLSKSAQEAQGRTDALTQIFNLNMRTRILDAPFLFHDLSYFDFRSTGVSTTMRSTLSNGLSLSHAFNEFLSSTARAAREDGVEERGSVGAYVYSASLRAVPIKTLTHSLTFSGRSETNPDGHLNRNSLYLSNTADFYQGVSVFLGGGYSMSTLETGREEESTSVNFGSTIVPNRKVTLTLNYTAADTALSGGDLPDSSLTSRRTDLSAAYHPFETVYLFASISSLTQSGKRDTLKNYSVDWSPFSGGALQFSFSYNENLRTQDNTVDKIMRPSVRWKITSRSFLDLSYLDIKSKSDTQEITTKIFSANLRIPL